VGSLVEMLRASLKNAVICWFCGFWFCGLCFVVCGLWFLARVNKNKRLGRIEVEA
jgi:hypothetical protein